ncbi:MAG TPA: TMEM165/GDT1 family protein [Nitrospiria bacterium]|jgi:putative Ca2+/H+ antiporter (TMEM165/GDT1 family)|nr:TMEM165/GDT1 family protein [Nitrospiria bacterium]
MDAFLISMAVIAAAEFGDKTQFLALLFGARFRRPLPIILGMLGSSIANYTLACTLGLWLRNHLDGSVLHWILGVLLIAVAFWFLVPDRSEGEPRIFGRFGAFGTAFLTFFLTEMGDKTQIAAVILAAKFNALIPVIIGTTVGVMLVNAPIIVLGNAVGTRLPVRAVRLIGAGIFGGLGVLSLSGFSF